MRQADIPQLALMRQGIDYKFKISCRAFEFTVRPLTNLEIIQATSEAAEKYAKMPETQRITITASLLTAMHQLEKASSDDIGSPPAVTMAMMQAMTPDEVNHLWKQYVNVTERVNPSFEEMSVAELDALVSDLKKSSDIRSQLIDLSISKTTAVCLRLLELHQG